MSGSKLESASNNHFDNDVFDVLGNLSESALTKVDKKITVDLAREVLKAMGEAGKTRGLVFTNWRMEDDKLVCDLIDSPQEEASANA